MSKQNKVNDQKHEQQQFQKALELVVENGSPEVKIAGIYFKCTKLKVFKNETVGKFEISPNYNPLIKIENCFKEKSYTVTIGTYLPNELNEIKESMCSSAFEVISKYLYIKYNGITNINTEITTKNIDEMVLCRDFDLIYDSKISNSTKFCFYLIEFQYYFAKKEAFGAEAIIVKDENLDPRTTRGTVTTPRNPGL